MPDPFSLAVASLSLVISGATMWLTLLKRGSVRMTQPTVIFFGPDGEGSQKVYIRTLLYRTSSRGQVIENAFLRLRREGAAQTFNIWVLGEGSLARGSGLYVGEEGITCNHHFLLAKGSPLYNFKPGEYQVEVYVTLVGDRRPPTRPPFYTSSTTSANEPSEISAGCWGFPSRRFTTTSTGARLSYRAPRIRLKIFSVTPGTLTCQTPPCNVPPHSASIE